MLELVDRINLKFIDISRERSSRSSDIKCVLSLINILELEAQGTKDPNLCIIYLYALQAS